MTESGKQPRRGRGRAAKRRRPKLIVFALLALAIALRAKDLGVAPAPLATTDEYHYAWAGLSLLAEGRPTAWSYLTGYHETPALKGQVKAFGTSWQVVSPAMDHPPLYSLLAGGWARLMGAAPVRLTTNAGREVTLWNIDLTRCRILSLVLFAAGFLLLYDLAARRCGFAVAIVALLLYGCVSHMVLHSRLLVTETLTTPLLLAGFCAWDRYQRGQWSERLFAGLTILLVAAATLCKLVAASQAAALCFLLLAAGRRRAALYPILGVALGVAFYALFGLWQDGHIFLRVLASQSARWHGFGMLEEIVINPLLVHAPARSYPLLLGWGALFAVAAGFKSARGRLLIGAVTAYFLAFGFFAAVPAIYGWHLMPFHPFMALAVAIVFMEAYRRPGPSINVAAAALLVPMALEAVYVEHTQWGGSMRYCYLAIAAVAIGLPLLRPRRAHAVQRAILIAALAALLIHEFWMTWFGQAS